MTRRKQALALLLAAAALVPLAASGRLGAERTDVFAAVRFTPEPGRVDANRERLAGLVREAARDGARYVVLPELATTGPAPVSAAEPVPGPTTRFFGDLAEELGIWIALSLPEAVAGGYHVTTLLIDDRGEVLARHRKVLPRPADGPLVRGNPRDIPRSLDDRGRRIGVLSGDDLLAGVPQLASRGAESILVSAAWGAGEPVAWEDLCRRLSREHQVNLVVAGVGIFTRSGKVIEAPADTRIARAALAVPDSWVPAPPLGLPSLPVPAAETLTPELVELGRALFFDRSLSRDRSTACATCHQPEKAFANGESAGTGIYGKRTPRNVPSLLNVAFRGALFWDGYAGTLENQVKYPVSHAFEMDSPYLDGMLAAVRANPEYRRGFRNALGRDRNALGHEEIGFEDVARALAAYQRVLLSANSPFDRYLYGGQHEALPPAARRGLDLFVGKAGCVSCHAVGPDHALLQDDAFHNTGVGWDPATGAFRDGGLGLLSDSSRVGQFFTPSLRNAALTAPYMHDGSLATLEEVVAFYDRGGNPNPGLDPLVRPLRLDARERADLVSFLRSLTGDRTFSADGKPLDRPSPWTLPVGELARFAVVRFAPEPGQVARNRAALAGLVERAAGRGASFVVLPEHAETGPLSSDELGETEESLAFLSELARRHGLWVAATAGGREAVLVDPEGLPVLSQPKLFPRPERGDGAAARGDVRRLRTVPTPAGRIGVLSGDDLREGVSRLAELGAETVLVSASWTRGDAVDWNRLARDLAAEHRVNLVVSDLVEEGEKPGLFVVLVGEAGEVSDLLPPGHAADTPVVTVSLAPREPVKPQRGLPPVPRPAGSLSGPEAVELGRKLFFDPILSADASVSCASCHRPELGFADGRKVSRGIADRAGQRNTPTLLNVAYRPFLFWEGRARTLEEQVLHAVQGWFEMASDAGEALERVRRDPEYRRAFRRVTGRDELRWSDVAAVLAGFERTLVSGDSPFDRWYYGGEASAVSERAKRGFRVFAGAGRCASCHTLGERAALFSDLAFHNTGVGFHERFVYLGYGGDGVEGNVARDNRFRGEYLTPSLRNIALTAPYMHDGSLATLRDVVELYARGGIPNPHLDPGMRPLTLSERDKEDLVEFMLTLTGPMPPAARDPRRMIASHPPRRPRP